MGVWVGGVRSVLAPPFFLPPSLPVPPMEPFRLTLLSLPLKWVKVGEEAVIH